MKYAGLSVFPFAFHCILEIGLYVNSLCRYSATSPRPPGPPAGLPTIEYEAEDLLRTQNIHFRGIDNLDDVQASIVLERTTKMNNMLNRDTLGKKDSKKNIEVIFNSNNSNLSF
jgi:hypothetical protein